MTALYEVELRWPVKANDRGAILTTPEDIAQFAERYAKSVTLQLAEEAERTPITKFMPNVAGTQTVQERVAAWLREKAR